MSTAAEAIRVVDDALRRIAESGLAEAAMAPRPGVTVGPLDREAEGPRLNWFLYRIAPNPAYRNMEPPRTGSRTSRGSPPLALELHYLLTTYPAALTTVGEQEQIAHIALAAAMRALHENAVVATGSPFFSAPPPQLVEPLRIALETLDVDTLSKVWTAASQPLRLSAGYMVSLVVVEQHATSVTGPPVRQRRVLVLPTTGPRLLSATPGRIGGPDVTRVVVNGLVAGTSFTLAPEADDPAPQPTTGWPMVVTDTTADAVTLRLPSEELRAGVRRLDVSLAVDGLPVHGDSIALTVVPTVRAVTGTVVAGATVTLTTAHCGPDTEVLLDSTPLDATVDSATQVRIVVPPGFVGGRTLTLRSRQVAGPPYTVTVTP